MKLNRAILSLLVAMLLPIGAMADGDFNYSFFDIKYADNGISDSYTESSPGETVSLDVDGGSGFAVLGSVAINENWHAFADYAATDIDLKVSAMGGGMNESLKMGGDIDDWRIGFGYNAKLGAGLDGIVQLTWEDRKIDFGSVTVLGETQNLDIDDNGVGMLAGLRGKVTDKFELNGHVRYSQILGIDLAAEANKDALDNDVILAVGGLFDVNDMFSIGANVETGDSTAWYAFARIGFRS